MKEMSILSICLTLTLSPPSGGKILFSDIIIFPEIFHEN